MTPVPAAARCPLSALTVTVTPHGSMMSQTNTRIALTNHSRTACTVTGYPRLGAVGHTFGGADQPLTVHVQDSATYFVPDPGPHTVTLRPGRSASAAMETVLAYEGGANLIAITQLIVTPPGATHGVTVACRTGITGPTGGPLPIMVTAFSAN